MRYTDPSLCCTYRQKQRNRRRPRLRGNSARRPRRDRQGAQGGSLNKRRRHPSVSSQELLTS